MWAKPCHRGHFPGTEGEAGGPPKSAGELQGSCRREGQGPRPGRGQASAPVPSVRYARQGLCVAAGPLGKSGPPTSPNYGRSRRSLQDIFPVFLFGS